LRLALLHFSSGLQAAACAGAGPAAVAAGDIAPSLTEQRDHSEKELAFMTG
jgi:hypothetical protein